jgi:thiol-disulfide isomerase/thioredoxin
LGTWCDPCIASIPSLKELNKVIQKGYCDFQHRKRKQCQGISPLQRESLEWKIVLESKMITGK